jgi:hypothetical protein
MIKDNEMRLGVEYEFVCKVCCNGKEDTPCKLTAEAEFVPIFCPFEEGKRCNWKMVEGVEDGK